MEIVRHAQRYVLIPAIVTVLSLLFMACGDDNGNGNGAAGEPTAPTGDGGQAAPADQEQVHFAFVPGWDEGVAATFLWKVILEDQGYTVQTTALEVGATFAAVAQGDVDLYLDAWLPGTHANYMDQFGEQIEQLSVWYEPADLYLTVPSYVEEVNSLAQLSENAGLFNSTIVGIESGAGMMGILREDVMPGYGIDDWQLIEGSTPAMLAELDNAISNQEPIVVTLWSPGWWFDEYDLKNLEDPQNLWGDPDEIVIITREQFEQDFPQLSGWLENFEMNDEQLGSLENLIRDHGEGDEETAVREWLEDNQDVVNSWTTE